MSCCVYGSCTRDLFIEMHFGPKRYVDPEPFANSLMLDHAIQQVRPGWLHRVPQQHTTQGASASADTCKLPQSMLLVAVVS